MRRYRCRAVPAAVVAAGLWANPAMAASEYLQKLGPDDDAYALVEEMEKRGCTMTEKEITAFLNDRGAGISGVQTVILDLTGAGDLVWDLTDSYTLVGWKTCP